jgi:hypothetical protein
VKDKAFIEKFYVAHTEHILLDKEKYAEGVLFEEVPDYNKLHSFELKTHERLDALIRFFGPKRQLTLNKMRSVCNKFKKLADHTNLPFIASLPLTPEAKDFIKNVFQYGAFGDEALLSHSMIGLMFHYGLARNSVYPALKKLLQSKDEPVTIKNYRFKLREDSIKGKVLRVFSQMYKFSPAAQLIIFSELSKLMKHDLLQFVGNQH